MDVSLFSCLDVASTRFSNAKMLHCSYRATAIATGPANLIDFGAKNRDYAVGKADSDSCRRSACPTHPSHERF